MCPSQSNHYQWCYDTKSIVILHSQLQCLQGFSTSASLKVWAVLMRRLGLAVRLEWTWVRSTLLISQLVYQEVALHVPDHNCNHWKLAWGLCRWLAGTRTCKSLGAQWKENDVDPSSVCVCVHPPKVVWRYALPLPENSTRQNGWHVYMYYGNWTSLCCTATLTSKTCIDPDR